MFTLLALTGLAASPARATAAGPPANISLSPLAPAVITADGSARATATVTLTDAALNPIPGDSSGLSLSASDPGVTFTPVIDHLDGTYTFSVVSSTTAHAVLVTATETTAGISAGQYLIQARGPARTVTVALAPNVITADTLATSTATIRIADAHGNAISGEALALSSSDPGVRLGTIADRGGGVYTAPVTASGRPGAITIRATDLSAIPQPSGSATLTEVAAPSLLGAVTMQWTFHYTRAYTVAQSLIVSGAPARASVILGCAGRGCPFGRVSLAVAGQPRCGPNPQRVCRRGPSLLLTPRVAHRRLGPGARLTVRVVRVGWIGKFYGFAVRPSAGPAISIGCLAPGATQPSAGCG